MMPDDYFEGSPIRRGGTIKRKNPGVDSAIRIAGSQVALAQIMRVKQPAVNYWLYVECPPAKAVEIERKLGVSRNLIRPDIFD